MLVVSGVRGYAPHDAQAKVSRPATSVAQAAATAARKPSPASRSASSKPVRAHRNVVEPASLATPAPKVTSSKAARKKIHHNQDDDYVAKDTYVYYGPNGKSTR
jgi:hypothetical protein